MVEWTHSVAVHESADPGALRGRILDLLRAGELHPSLLYSGLRQATLWTALHHALSPAQADPAVAALYAQAFARAARQIAGNVAHTVSLACGDGTKDLRCLQALRERECAVLYSPADISLEMVLAARGESRKIPGLQCSPLVLDLLHCSVLPGILKSFDPSGAERLILFLGTIHNCDPGAALKNIAHAVRVQDQLLIGANLAPAEDYDSALERILPQYNNEPTRAWLWGALSELGLNASDGALSIRIAGGAGETKRFEAVFEFGAEREIAVLGERIQFEKGANLRIFYSQRFTPDHLRARFAEAGLELQEQWIAPEEGLFLCRRAKRGQ